ncbi:MAG: hypothetical protein Q4F74_03090, partial [Synergistaceae bacterium]|nr:hypothetical protein [Synergistaceae bacterium]
IEELLTDPKRLLEAAELPDAEFKAAMYEMGYDFSPKELDDYVCMHYDKIQPIDLGEGDNRDIIVRKWGVRLK